MPSTKSKFISGLFLLTSLLVSGLINFRNILFDDSRLCFWIVSAIAIFFLYEMMSIALIDKKSKTLTGKQSINFFLGLKVGKIILSLLFIGVFIIAVNVELKRFILVFISLYLVYLLFDTLYLVYLEKKLKNKKTIEE